ncbi:MAG TPA: TIGR03435 family protein [Granulicella sp.]|nr:TIGR03435 family protein [Granulicella sp.]
MSIALFAVHAPGSWAQSHPVAPAAAVAAAPAGEVHPRGDIAGDWQGTLEAGKSLRLILRVAKTDKGWGAKMYSIDQGAQGFNANSITLDGASFKYSVDLIGGSYQGTLSADGNTIAGTWTQGPNPLPLTLVRATKETAWEIPAPPPPPKLMAADADPSFDVATIKPNDSGAAGMQGLTLNGRNFATRNSSLEDLISFAYDVQAKQIIGAPDWINKDRYDIAAVPEQEGAPNPKQLKIMIRKLLADRFKLTFHNDKRELSAYVLTVTKSGQKLTPTQMNGPLPGIGMRPKPEGLMLIVGNGTLTDFTGFLQTIVLDRPVVNQTGLTAKFDFSFTFTPNDSQFNGHPPPLPAHTDSTELSPDLFQALQQQLGLKLDAEKTPVDVIAIDHVEKPSAN